MEITLKNLSLGYKNRTLLEGVNACFNQGRTTALLGRNGTGKSTLLRAISSLGSVQEGEILLGDKNIKTLKTDQISKLISFVATDKIRIANLSCEQLVSLGRVPYTNWIGRITQEDKQIVDHALKLVGMADYAQKPINKISDGECQRVMIARALAQDTPIILLDEPTAFLDLPNKYEICSILKNLAENQGKTIIFSTHDLEIAMQTCNDIAIIDSQKITIGSPQMQKSEIDRLFRFSLINPK